MAQRSGNTLLESLHESLVCGVPRSLTVIASAAKQSIAQQKERMDCFVAALLAMTE
jgi:hypothetical protein